MNKPLIAVLGGGAWGTALALASLRAGNTTALIVRDAATAENLNRTKENARYLPGIPLPLELGIYSDPSQITPTHLIAAIPAQTFIPYLKSAKLPALPLLIAAKGILAEQAELLVSAAALFHQGPLSVLSGPSFATELARNQPTAVVIAGEANLAASWAELLASRTFRPYTSTDIIGVQLGGALKNVMAIAAGLVAGLGLGENARAALITRALAEMARLGVALGGNAETLMGLSGVGDLILSASSSQSRNYQLGLRLATDPNAHEHPGALTEGVATTKAAYTLITRHQLEAPIIQAMYALLFENVPAPTVIEALLKRPLKAEGV